MKPYLMTRELPLYGCLVTICRVYLIPVFFFILDKFLWNELFVKGYACKRGANYNELFPFTKVWIFIQHPLYFDTTHIHTSLLIPALKDSKCVLRKDFFEERLYVNNCSKVFKATFYICRFLQFLIPKDLENVEEICITG